MLDITPSKELKDIVKDFNIKQFDQDMEYQSE